MEKKTIIAIVLCIAVWLIWSMFFMETPEPTAAPDGGLPDGATAAGQGEPAGPAGPAGPDRPDGAEQAAPAPDSDSAPAAELGPEQLAEIEGERFKAVFSSHGAALKRMELFNYEERDENRPGADLGPENLVSTEQEGRLPLSIRFRKENSSFKLGTYQDWRIVSQSAEEVVFLLEDPTDANTPVITKRFRISPEQYQIDLEVELENRSESSIEEQIILDLFANYAPPAQTGCFGAPSAPRTPMCMKGEQTIPSSSGCTSVAKLNAGEARTEEPNINWTGINEQYFLMAAVPLEVDRAVCRISARHDNLLIASLMYPETDIPPGTSASHRFRIYAGPKKMSLLEQIRGGVGKPEKPARLTGSVDYGWFAFLCHPMLWLLKNFYSFLGNYGLAIIMLTIVIKVLLLPLTHKSMKSMGEMAKLKPLMEELKKKHGDDKQKLNQEMMNLYKTHKINPMGGCFPMLLQMPIWIALYRMLYSSVELYQAPFIAGWLGDLSYRDPYYILPIVLGGTMFLQQWLSPTSADSQQAKMMLYIMPAFFTFIMLYLPSGLVLYIFVNSLLSIAHQLIYNKMRDRKQAALEGAGGT